MIIGTFRNTNGTINGVITTLALTTQATFKPLKGKTKGLADYRITDGVREIGAAWKKTSEAGTTYYSVQIDDPCLAAPINCALVKADGATDYNLLWSRQSRQRG